MPALLMRGPNINPDDQDDNYLFRGRIVRPEVRGPNIMVPTPYDPYYTYVSYM